MGKYRTIGNALDPGYRNDLNTNFDNIDIDIKDVDQKRLTDKTGLTAEIQRVEKDSITLVNTLIGEDAIVLIHSTKDARESANVAASTANASATNADTQADFATAQGDYAKAQGDYAQLKGDYADEKAILADEKATLAANEASNLGQMKLDVVEATATANTSATNADTIANNISVAEDLRVTAESNRVTEENARKSNETIRQQQEGERQTNTEEAISNAETATQNAQKLVDTSVHLREYNPTTAYVENNEVRYNGSTWRCLQDCVGITPIEGVNWTLVAQRGVDGTGAVSTVNSKSPDEDGNIVVSAGDVGAIPSTEKGAPGGTATLDEYGKVPDNQLNISTPSDASTTVKGITMLSSEISNDETSSATPKAVKIVADSVVTLGEDLANLEQTSAAHQAKTATETTAGHVELATASETTSGTDTTRAVHPAGLKVELDKKISKNPSVTKITPTLYNGWVNVGGSNVVAGYYKDDLGFVHIEGRIKSGVNSGLIFTLDVGYRPDSGYSFTTHSVNGTTYQVSEIYVFPNGEVKVFNSANTVLELNITPFRGY